MSGWLERLKNQKAPDTHPTKTTKTVSVVSVGWVQGAPEKSWAAAVPSNDAASAVMVTTAPSSVNTCTNCQHLLRPGTCAEPEAAGLIPAGAGFSLAWPPTGYANTCASYSSKTAASAQERPYKLTPADADTCHAGGWDDFEIARFQARAAALRRRGVADDDAGDLAERLTLRDRERDARVLCAECSHYRPGRCGNHKAAGLLSKDVGRDMAARLQRCPGFSSEFASKEKT